MKKIIGAIAATLVTALLCLNGCYFNYRIKDDEFERIELENIVRTDEYGMIRKCVAKSTDHSEIMQIINTTKQRKYSDIIPEMLDHYIYIYYQDGVRFACQYMDM